MSISRKKNLLSSIYSQGTILVHLIRNFSLMSNLEADHELGQFRDQPERVSPLRLAINLAGDFNPQAAEASQRIEVRIFSFDKVFAENELLIFELGFFYAALERKTGRIVLLHKGDLDLPSDISGIVWIDISNGIAAAGEEIRKEVAEVATAVTGALHNLPSQGAEKQEPR